jgi:hypothetical protein
MFRTIRSYVLEALRSVLFALRALGGLLWSWLAVRVLDKVFSVEGDPVDSVSRVWNVRSHLSPGDRPRPLTVDSWQLMKTDWRRQTEEDRLIVCWLEVLADIEIRWFLRQSLQHITAVDHISRRVDELFLIFVSARIQQDSYSNIHKLLAQCCGVPVSPMSSVPKVRQNYKPNKPNRFCPPSKVFPFLPSLALSSANNAKCPPTTGRLINVGPGNPPVPPVSYKSVNGRSMSNITFVRNTSWRLVDPLC